MKAFMVDNFFELLEQLNSKDKKEFVKIMTWKRDVYFNVNLYLLRYVVFHNFDLLNLWSLLLSLIALEDDGEVWFDTQKFAFYTKISNRRRLHHMIYIYDHIIDEKHHRTFVKSNIKFTSTISHKYFAFVRNSHYRYDMTNSIWISYRYKYKGCHFFDFPMYCNEIRFRVKTSNIYHRILHIIFYYEKNAA